MHQKRGVPVDLYNYGIGPIRGFFCEFGPSVPTAGSLYGVQGLVLPMFDTLASSQ